MEIQLGGRGGVALVSPEDYEMVKKYSWHESQGYATCTSYNNNESSLMHRLIMKPKDNEMIDHINNNRLDNRRENLRICNVTVNNLNRKKTKNASSQYKGVYFDKKSNKYTTQISNNGKTYSLGQFENEIDAAEQVDKFILFNKWDYIYLNFPDKKKKYEKNPYVPKVKKCGQYSGVSKSGKKYNCTVYVNGKGVYLGKFEDEIMAAKAYDEYVVKNNIPNKNLNFPNQYPNYCKNPKIIKSHFIDTKDKNIIKVKMSNENKYTEIDRNNYDKIKHYPCHISKKDGYVKISVNRKCLPLHRFLIGVTDSQIYIDHINSDKLNNTRANLRLSNAKLNGQNMSKRRNVNSSSKYLGVHFHNGANRWISKIWNGSKNIFHCGDKIELVVVAKRDLFLLENPQYHYKLNLNWDNEMIKMWKEFVELDSNHEASKYIGVCFNNKLKRWYSHVWSENKRKNIFYCSHKNEMVTAIKRDLFFVG
jgi:hypothetical protein